MVALLTSSYFSSALKPLARLRDHLPVLCPRGTEHVWSPVRSNEDDRVEVGIIALLLGQVAAYCRVRYFCPRAYFVGSCTRRIEGIFILAFQWRLACLSFSSNRRWPYAIVATLSVLSSSVMSGMSLRTRYILFIKHVVCT